MVKKGGLVLFIDESYESAVLATSEVGFSAPDGLAWHGGRVYLADEGGKAVVTWSLVEGVRPLADQRERIQSPEDLVVAEDGTVFFTDDDAGGLWQIARTGEVSQLAGKSQGLVSTEGLAVAPDGCLLVGDGVAHVVFRVTRSGDVSVFLGPEAGIDKPESMVYDPAGNLYIADNRRNIVYQLDREGRLRKLISGVDGPIQPESLCYQNASLFITDNQAGKLYRFTPGEGLATVLMFAGSLKNLQGIAAGPNGSVLVTVQDLKRRHGLLLQVMPPAATILPASKLAAAKAES